MIRFITTDRSELRLHRGQGVHFRLSFPQNGRESCCKRRCWDVVSLYWHWCELTSPLLHTIGCWGTVGFTWTDACCQVHLCGTGCSFWTPRLWRRWIPYRCPCQQGLPARHTHAHTPIHTYTPKKGFLFLLLDCFLFCKAVITSFVVKIIILCFPYAVVSRCWFVLNSSFSKVS